MALTGIIAVCIKKVLEKNYLSKSKKELKKRISRTLNTRAKSKQKPSEKLCAHWQNSSIICL